MLFCIYVVSVLVFKYIICTGVEAEKRPYQRVKIENRHQLDLAIGKILKTTPRYTQGGTWLAIQLLKRQRNEKGQVIDQVYKNLDRSTYVGILPRCLCRYMTCTIPICSSVWFNDSIPRKVPFESLECLGECIPLFMRCLTGSEH